MHLPTYLMRKNAVLLSVCLYLTTKPKIVNKQKHKHMVFLCINFNKNNFCYCRNRRRAPLSRILFLLCFKIFLKTNRPTDWQTGRQTLLYSKARARSLKIGARPLNSKVPHQPHWYSYIHLILLLISIHPRNHTNIHFPIQSFTWSGHNLHKTWKNLLVLMFWSSKIGASRSRFVSQISKIEV